MSFVQPLDKFFDAMTIDHKCLEAERSESIAVDIKMMTIHGCL